MASNPASGSQAPGPQVRPGRSQPKVKNNWFSRELIALIVIAASIVIIAVICWIAISSAEADKVSATAEKMLTIVLPVLATWVGAVIAFYFGRENFESAQAHVRELVGSMPSGTTPSAAVFTVMRKLEDTTHIKGSDAGKLQIVMVKAHFAGNVTRLLIINDASAAMYVIHKSSIEEFENEGGKATATLNTFLSDRKSKKNLSFGPGFGFVTVSKDVTIDDAKQSLESAPGCRDIIVTETGDSKEPVLGWISNTRLGRVT
jgi:hypothetical protein